MSKTAKIILIITAIFTLLFIGLFAFYSYVLRSDNQVDTFDDFTDTYIFGRPTTDTIGGDGFGLSTTTSDGVDREVTIPKLRKISDSPVAGFFSFEGDDGVVSIRYTERSTGHIYEAKTNSLTKKRISNTTIPRVQESVWVNKDSSIIRYLDEGDNIKNFYAEIVDNKNEDGDLVEGKIEGVFLVDNMEELISLGNRLFYLLKDSNGSRGFTSDLNGDGVVEIFNSPLKEWLIERPEQGVLTMTTKPTFDATGYLYFLNTSTGRTDKEIKGTGLTTLTNSNLSQVLYSRSTTNGFAAGIHDVVSKENTPFPIGVLPEKCVWGSDNVGIYCGIPKNIPRNEYPDSWYQGEVSFSDNIYKINTEDDSFELLVSPNDVAREEIDLIKPDLGPNEEYLFFINKKDLSLWSLELES